MTGSDKVYNAPRLETLSLRETRDIDISVILDPLASVHVHVGLGGLLS
jgi:hypothetical protein